MIKNNLVFVVFIYFILYGVEYFANLINKDYPFDFIQLNLNTGLYFLCSIFALSFTSIKVQLIAIFALLTITLLQILNFQYFSSYILPISYYQFFMQFGEIVESFLGEISKMILPLIFISAIALLCTYLFWKFKNQSVRRNNRWPIFFIFILFTSDLYSFNHILSDAKDRLWQFQAEEIMPMPNRLAVNNAYRSFKYFLLGIFPKKIWGNSNTFPSLTKPEVIETPNINIVFVIGESLRAQQLSILGYDKQTTPFLESIDDLYANTIYASGTMTKSSIAGLMNRLKYPGGSAQIASQNNCLFNLAKNNGFTTHFISAQDKRQLSIVENLICKNNIDSYRPFIYDNDDNTISDITLVRGLDFIDFDKNNFIILHQRGSHSPYEKRSPKEFKRFELEYDNSVLYTDHILNELINKLKKMSHKTSYFIFTSDHGELLDGEGVSGHGWFKEQVYKVPFLFYVHQPDKLKNNIRLQLPFVQTHFDVTTLITKLLGYDVEVDHSTSKNVYINGSDVDGLAGYMHLKLNKNNVLYSEIKHY